MLLDNWIEDAAAPPEIPAKSGEWRLNGLRWALLKAALSAPHNSRVSARGPALRPAIAEAGLAGPFPLQANHEANGFDCGTELLNKLLRKSIAQVAAGDDTGLTTRVFTFGNRIAAFYSTRPIAAVSDAEPGKRINLLFVARLGIDRRWSEARLTDNFFFEMLRDVWSVPPQDRPAALVGITVSPAAKRILRWIGARTLGDALDPRAIMFPAVDIAASIEAGEKGLGLAPLSS